MNLTELRTRTRRYVRDIAAKRFTNTEIDEYINEGVDRIRSYSTFKDMPYINAVDAISHIPTEYHYMLALFAAQRCFSADNDFYQEQSKRNEFENMFADLITRIEIGEITILDETFTEVANNWVNDAVTDVYFNGSTVAE